jgi:PAS domain-containing protein
VVAANRPLARLLGYESPAELVSVGEVCGVFASLKEQARVAELLTQGADVDGELLFRRKNGGPRACRVLGAVCEEPEAVAIVVLEPVSAASSGDTHSG